MSIENNIERIATALELIASLMGKPVQGIKLEATETSLGEVLNEGETLGATAKAEPEPEATEKPKRTRRTKAEIAEEKANKVITFWHHESSGEFGINTRAEINVMLEENPDITEITKEMYAKLEAEGKEIDVEEGDNEEEIEDQPKAEVLQLTLTDVKEEIMKASRRDRREEARKLLGEFGAAKISELKESDYEAVIKAAKEL